MARFFHYSPSIVIGATLIFNLSMPGNVTAQSDDTDLADDEPSSTCPLSGLEEGAVTVWPSDGASDDAVEVCLYNRKKRLACTTTKGTVNEAKLTVMCRGDRIDITSQAPFSSSSHSFSFRYAKGRLSLAKQEKADPSASAMAAYEKALKRGKIKEAVDHLESVLYPDHYYNATEVCADLMVAAHKAAGAALKKKQWQTAANAIGPAWDWCAAGPLADGTSPAAKLAPGLILALNDYGYALTEGKDFAKGEKVLRKVVALDNNRTPAWLNLGDALRGQGKDATDAYGEYCKRVPRAKWPARLAEASAKCR